MHVYNYIYITRTHTLALKLLTNCYACIVGRIIDTYRTINIFKILRGGNARAHAQHRPPTHYTVYILYCIHG